MGDKMENLIKNYKQVQEKLKKIVSLGKIKREEPIGYTTFGFPIEHYSLGEGKKHIILEAGIHGCEIITVDFLLQLMEEMSDGKDTQKWNTKEYKFHFFPLMNPEGYIISTSAIQALFPKDADFMTLEKICKNYYIKYRQDDLDSKKVMQEINEIEQEEERMQSLALMRRQLKYYQEIFKEIDYTCIPDEYQELKENIKKIYEENKIPKGSLQIWSSNGNGVDLEENCEENKRYYLTKEEYAKLRYENININQVGPIGCPNKNKKEFELEPENKAIYQFIQELQKQEGTIIYISYHSTGGLIYYRSHCEKQKKQEFNRKLALGYQEKTDYTIMEEEKENCNEVIMRNLVDGHIKIELSPMGGNPIGPYGDIKGNYLPTIQKNIEALKYMLEKIF